jgi:acid phosphatase family membrane protein YuiD
MTDVLEIAIGFLAGLVSSTTFILVLLISFCTLIGFAKLRKTAGGRARVVKSLDEVVSGESFVYLSPTDPRGPADQLHTPELIEAAARRS